MFDFVWGYQGDTPIDDTTIDQVLKASERPNIGVNNAYVTPRFEQSANWMSNGELSDDFTLISNDNVERGESNVQQKLKQLKEQKLL